jgi:hypothetical protein
MDSGFLSHPSGHSLLSRWRILRPVLLMAAAVLAALSAAALVTTCMLGPISLASVSVQWEITFSGTAAAVIVWWALYMRILGQLGGERPWVQLHRITWPLAALSTSLLPDLAIMFSGRLPYVLLFDVEGYRQFRYVAGAIIGAAVLLQELMLIEAAQGMGITALFAAARVRLAKLSPETAWVPRAARRGLWTWLSLAVLLLAGIKLRIDSLDVYAGGDMDVMLSITYNILRWPPVTYYYNYMPQTWVYNHLPLFPITLAPAYWIFENLLHLPTIWAAKLVIGLADLVIALLLYRQARGRWRRVWGLILAGMWLLAPWVVGGDDHPIAVAITFALLAFANAERGWLCGLLLALGVATRNEVAFFVLPMVLHFCFHRGWRQATAFLGTFGTTLSLIAVPFFLYDPGAMDYALRRQLQRDASGEMSMLTSFLAPRLGDGIGAVLQQNPTLLALALNLLISLVALRDGRVARVAMLASLGYLVTLPIVFGRYMLFSYAISLFYSAWYVNPLIAAAAGVILWPNAPLQTYVLLVLFAALIIFAVLRPDRRAGPTPSRRTDT